ncbi:receptor expression-enhancing protein 2-like isoform X4 [Eupeodes corollae]|uniref:receptor expression-enhancing protein 2-like isoform X4 n=1 Tax=Eupeodes corollae TaxID=290404 RepID=UPI002490824F|nr:receptor expression-enhancing protein 2-like isoform X4 [Eupeodes corollae]
MRRTAVVGGGGSGGGGGSNSVGGSSYPTPTSKRIRNIDELIYQYEKRYQTSHHPPSRGEGGIELYLNRPWPSNYHGAGSLSSLTDSEFCSDSDAPPRQIAQPKVYLTNASPRSMVTIAATGEEQVIYNLTMVGRFLDMLQRMPLPRMSLTATGICFLIAIFITPKTCAQSVIFPTFRLTFGTLYPAYASYKAVRTKNVKEYVKWMMYWIVYAFFNCTETFTDIFLSWFPFYYEVKVIIVLWLLSPATKGSSTLYRKFVHPMLTRREQEIDEYLNQAKERGYSAVLQLGSKGVNYATNVIMQTALKTFQSGGLNLVGENPRMLVSSQSDNTISVRTHQRNGDETDGSVGDGLHITPPDVVLRSRSLNAVNYHEEFSEEDDQFATNGENDDDYMPNGGGHQDEGAVRCREAPKRKTRLVRSKVQDKKTTQIPSVGSKLPMRGRRKLRESTPDVDVDIE